MTVENHQTKGRRYVTEGRLRVMLVQSDRIYAECRGQGEVWHCGYAKRRWWCDCPARTRCSHLVALQLVTAAPARAQGEA